jgi:uncharacterized protein (TIGR03435 family)
MAEGDMSEWLRAMGPGVANHLWQSTAVAAVAWVVTLLLRRNQARVRYGVWVAASVKFLLPFSLLVGLGGMLPRPQKPVVAMPLYSAVDEVGMPFSAEGVAVADPTHAAMKLRHGWGTRLVSSLPAVLAGVWGFGVAGVLVVWCGGWLRVKRTLRRAVRAEDGREAEILRRVEVALGGRVRLALSRELMEPGMFGILRPVLIWPERLSERLDDEHIEAIMAHELMHARRGDNLTAALHMIVEAAFWFHPLVWWMERRMVEERERSCDEAVVAMGTRPGVYAESLLKACRFCVESPMVCVAGITGADLAARVRAIMTSRAVTLGWWRKLLLSVAAMMAVALPVTFGLVRAAQVSAQSEPSTPAGNIAATWQGTLHTNRDLRFVVKITQAGDGTLRATFYNIDAAPDAIPAISTKFNGSLLKLELPFSTYEGNVSADGNSITGTWKQGPNPVPLNLARATPATEWAIPQPPRVAPMAADANPAFDVATIKPSRPEEPGPQFWMQGRRFSVVHTSPSDIVNFAFGVQQRQVAGAPDWFTSERYDISAVPDGEGEPNFKQWQLMVKKLMVDRFRLKFHYEKRELPVYALTVAKSGPKLTRSQSDPSAPGGKGFGPPGNFGATNATIADVADALGYVVVDRPVVDQTGLTGRFDLRLTWTPDGAPATESADAPPDLFTAIQQELGLKLESTKAPVDVLVIDHLERPSEN